VAFLKKRPLVGVTGPDRGGLAAWYFSKLALWRAGGKARRITPSKPSSINGLAGLIIGGGADVDPTLYGEEREHFLDEIHRKHQPLKWYLARLFFFPLIFLIRKLLSTKAMVGIDQKRDELEAGLLGEAYRKKLPILGICRGAQLINVFFEGGLHQNLTEFYTETPQVRTVLPRKKIMLISDSRLAAIIKDRECTVNALHRQAVSELGKELIVAAREENGVIQAIEHRNRPYLLGVQWHPEYLPQQKEQLAIFQALVGAASEPCAQKTDVGRL
jgi:putative glutamine amidotransferase